MSSNERIKLLARIEEKAVKLEKAARELRIGLQVGGDPSSRPVFDIDNDIDNLLLELIGFEPAHNPQKTLYRYVSD